RRPLVIDDFQVLSKLGEGGFGTVLLVRKRSNGKLFALKLLVKRHMMRSGDAQRAISESLAMQEIRHPFIVRLHYAFQ
ncbi:kinase-like domain-containing protein, partial [Pavlovales sp. CCMP2436]